MRASITFVGGAGTVTGSKYLLDLAGTRVLIDCGLFQGLKTLRLKNWAPLPVKAESISAVILTHSHVDHSGYLPLLSKQGFRGPVFCSEATRDLCRILLPDSAQLQERDAEFANRHGFSKHKPALPLYTLEDATRALTLLQPVQFESAWPLSASATALFKRAGHILGAASVELRFGESTIVFSGDLGRFGDPLMPDPITPERADYLILESTYGDRLHGSQDIAEALASTIERTIGRGGTLVIPAFAVGRAQLLLYYLHKLRASKRLPQVPIYVDSPMAIHAGDVFREHSADHRLDPKECREVFSIAEYVRDAEQSKALTANPQPKIIISASGMATGGRVIHHLKRYAPDPKSTILFAGYQAVGTRGAAMISGADTIKIHGAYIPVRAEVNNLDLLSAHADQAELVRWLRRLKFPPKGIFLTHGEPGASDTLRRRIQEEFAWPCIVAEQSQTVELR